MASRRCIGWVAAVLAGAFLLAWVSGENPLPARDEAKPAALPADLARIPSDGGFLMSVRVADLWDSELAKPARQKLAKELMEGTKEFETKFGVPLEQVERFSMVALDALGGRAEPEQLLFVHTLKPYERAKVIATVGKDAREEKYKGQVFYTGGKDAVYLIDDRSVVYGTTNEVRSLLDHPAPKTEGALAAALRLAAGKHALVQGLNVKVLNDTVGGMLPPQAEPFKPLLQARSAVLTVDVDTQARANLMVTFADEKAAVAGDKSLKAALEMARAALAEGLKQLAGDKEWAPYLPQLEQFQVGLKTATIEQKGAVLRGSASVKIDAATAGLAFIDAVQKVRSAASRQKIANDLKQLALTMHNYHDTYGSFPPHASYGKNGKPLLSWRVLILPFIEQQELYKEFKLDEPWDSAHNKKLLAKMPKLFAGADEKALQKHETYYQVLVGKDTVFEGKKGIRIATITDGTSNTIMIVEASKPVPWTRPEDVPYDATKPLPKLGHVSPAGFMAAMCDGSVRFISKKVTPQTLRNAITRNDGNPLGSDF